jgi:hypothetical protein
MPILTSWRNRFWLPTMLLSVVALFAIAGLVQVWSYLTVPYHYAWPMKDDYDAYHYWAVDIVEHGLAMRLAPVPYALPAGFLYIYFVALCYKVFGILPPVVFIVQSAMLGGSVVLLFLAFRDEPGRPAKYLLLLGLAAFAFLDVGRQYALQLFSENLLIFELAGFFYLTQRGFVGGRSWARILALAVLGAIPLTRPNAVLFVPGALMWLIVNRRGVGFWRDLASGLVAFAVVFSLMALRNHAAGGQWTAFPPFPRNAVGGLDVPGYGGPLGTVVAAGQAQDWRGTRTLVELALRAWWRDPLEVAREYGRRILFTGGFLPLVQPEFRYRPHWMIMWAVFVGALAWRLARGVELGPMVELLLIWLVTFLGPVVATTQIANYGFRYVVPGVLPAVAGAVVLLLSPQPRSKLARRWNE